MLAEIAARREALERARAEEAQRRAERAAESADSRGGAHL
jgi:F0F1-type ATP synthase epsilon subunit